MSIDVTGAYFACCNEPKHFVIIDPKFSSVLGKLDANYFYI